MVGTIGVMVTNGGSHPADKWAETSAAQIVGLIDIDADASSDAAKQARHDRRQFENALIDTLEGHHQVIQDHEKEQLKSLKDERLAHPVDPEEHASQTLDEAVAAVVEAAKVNPLFAAHFAKPEVQAVVRDIFRTNFATAMDIERSVYADKNQHNPKVQAWQTARAARGPGHAHVFMQPEHGVVGSADPTQST